LLIDVVEILALLLHQTLERAVFLGQREGLSPSDVKNKKEKEKSSAKDEQNKNETKRKKE
jgi:hypothetical protein